ncbi:MAG: SRPBCC family protein [Firmicutes bacterium]|nr:SRPBCC family protein [Alicyclobacillaceae bacterium]MCL6496780.1 SRPBCC family protein [Bacillota bacterium]
MPTVEVAERVAAPPEVVWAMLVEMEQFPTFMESLEAVEVLERGPDYTVTRWTARLKGSRFVWTERDDFDRERGRIEFHQVSGDLRVFEGYWQITPEGPDATRVLLATTFEFGVPMLAALLNPIARVALRDNARAMLAAIAARAGSSPAGSGVSCKDE